MSFNNTQQVMGPGDNEYTVKTDIYSGENFSCWKFRMTHVFKAAGLWDIVSGDEVCPEKEKGEEKKVFLRRSSKAYAILSSAVSTQILIGFQDCDDVATAWKRLCETHEQKAMVNKLYLRRQFFNSKMSPGSTMMEFVNQVRSLALNLKAIGVKLEDSDIIEQLLSGLPEEYEIPATTLDGSPLKVDDLVARLLAEEKRRLERCSTSTSDSVALFTKRREWPSGNKQLNENFTPRNDFLCYKCRKPGHIARNCTRRKKTAALTVSKSCGNLSNWIIDSGASEHMCSDRNLFNELVKDGNFNKVTVGNNSSLDVKGVGSIVFYSGNSRILLNRVLFVPGLAFNLISVSATSRNGNEVLFKGDACVIKNQAGNLIIEAKKQRLTYMKLKRNQR